MTHDILRQFNLYSVIDIAVVAYIVYRILLLIKGTRTIQMLVGLATLFVIFVLAQVFRLQTLYWILNSFLGSIILVLVILFQSEIRRGLVSVGKNPFSGSAAGETDENFIPDVARAAGTMANRKIGAIIVIERGTGLSDYIADGVRLEAKANKELLISMFLPTSPIHDGAIIIRKGWILAAGCFLPLATDLEIDPALGTRHRAALGISEETDAVVIVVSEERGAVSLVHKGKIYFNLDAQALEDRLRSLLG